MISEEEIAVDRIGRERGGNDRGKEEGKTRDNTRAFRKTTVVDRIGREYKDRKKESLGMTRHKDHVVEYPSACES